MIRFLIKGILRDPSKSIIPVSVITIGVMVTVLTSGFIQGLLSDLVNQNAKLDTGHVKVMTRPYLENKDQLPNDLAILDLSVLIETLETNYNDIQWVPRIKFSGILDVPDLNGDTKIQGPALGLAYSLFDQKSKETQRLGLKKSLISGRLPKVQSEILISNDFAKKLNIKPGNQITYFGSSMEGSMVFEKFTMVGTINFGIPLLDKGSFIMDISDAQKILDMEDGAGEILGYQENDIYNKERANEIKNQFNDKYNSSLDEFAPVMLTLRDQNELATTLDLMDLMTGIFIFIFILAMSMVLWNTGLIGGLRRHKEFGIRLALGESKRMVFYLLLVESFIIGMIGSVFGTALGISLCYYLQEVGIDISKDVANSSIIMPSIIRAHVSYDLFFIGFIPGLFSMLLGTALSGRAIFKRETARLFKDLEV
jgi:putative ABC transport system permease protein